MRIPESKIDEIRNSASIVDIISNHVHLRKRGKNFIGLCPFHTEKTPSFTVSEEKQIYHCFGCHAGGNVFKFLMDYKKISYVEAIQELADELGVTIEYEDKRSAEEQSEQEILYEINTEAAKYFSNNLLHSDEGEFAKKYFENRSIKLQTMRAFGLGYSLPGWDNFVNYAKGKKIDLNKAAALGLIGKSDDGRLYDKLSGRIIFPVFSPNGRVVAFAGRTLENREDTAKYINSPESIIYTKGRTLYGLSHAKDEIRRVDKALLVEGYMDLISLYQSGIKHVVAVSGTALTDEQAQLLSRYTRNVVLLFDADAAGLKASMRSIEILLKQNFEIKIAALPKGEDPDSFVNKHGRERFEELIERAQNFLEFQTAYFESLGMFEDAAKASEAIRELVKPIAIIDDELKRNMLIKTLSKKFNLREKLLESELEKALEDYNKDSARESAVQVLTQRRKISELAGKENKDENLPLRQIEKELIKLLCEGDNEIISFIFENVGVDEFSDKTNKFLAEQLYKSFTANENISTSALLDRLQDEAIQVYIGELTFEKYAISDKWIELNPGAPREKVLRKIAADTLKNFWGIKLEEEIEFNHQKLAEASDEAEKIQLMKLIRDLQIKKQSLNEKIKLS